MPTQQVWRNNRNGELFHDACFEVGESRDGFTVVKLEELAMDDECESCMGVFLSGLEPVVEDEEDEC